MKEEWSLKDFFAGLLHLFRRRPKPKLVEIAY